MNDKNFVKNTIIIGLIVVTIILSIASCVEKQSVIEADRFNQMSEVNKCLYECKTIGTSGTKDVQCLNYCNEMFGD